MKKFVCLLIAAVLLLCMPFMNALAQATNEVRYSTDGGATWSEASLFNALWVTYGQKNVKIELLRDIILDTVWYAQQDLLYGNDVTFELDGKGYTIHRGTCETMLFCVRGENSIATLKNITIDGGAVWQGSDPANMTNVGTAAPIANAHLIYVDSGATLVLEDGAILQNNDLGNHTYGAAVVAGYSDLGNGKVIMKDGAIIRGNRSKSGGGVCVLESGDVFEMQGGEISDNYAYDGGGAVFTAGSFTMKDGAITGNASGNNGGGVCVSTPGSFVMEDGQITGNQSVVGGGGITALSGSVTLQGGSVNGNSITGSMGGGILVYNGSLTVSGNPVVTGNAAKDNADNNVYLSSGKTIVIDGSLDDSAQIGVTTAVAPTESNPVPVTSGNSSDFSDRFISDSGLCWEENGTGNQVYLVYADAYDVVMENVTGGSVDVRPSRAAAGKTIRLIATPEDNYTLESVTITDINGDPVAVTNNSFVMPAGGAHVTVKFVEKSGVYIPSDSVADAAPKTGDNTNLVLWMSLMVLSAAGLVFLTRKAKKFF